MENAQIKDKYKIVFPNGIPDILLQESGSLSIEVDVDPVWNTANHFLEWKKAPPKKKISLIRIPPR